MTTFLCNFLLCVIYGYCSPDQTVCKNQNNSEGDTSFKSYAVVPYIQGVTEPIERILNNCNVKVALKPYLTLGHIFPKCQSRKILFKQIRKLMLYILYHSVTVKQSI